MIGGQVGCDPCQKSRRSAAETRAAIRRVAFELFTEKGFDATTTRDIAAALDMNQSSLYYHFAGKDEIVRSLMETRQRDVEDFLAWLQGQPRTPGLLRTAALRWLDGTSEEHVHGNGWPWPTRPPSGAWPTTAAVWRTCLTASSPSSPARTSPTADALYVRTVFNAVGSVLTAMAGRYVPPADIIATARRMVLAMTQS